MGKSKSQTTTAKKTSSCSPYGVKRTANTYMFNCAKNPLHPWSSNVFTMNGIRFRRLEQALAFYKAQHFKLGRKVKQQILQAQTGWDAVKVIREANISKEANWKDWGRWTMSNLLPILRQMAKDSPRFRDQLLSINESVIALCTKDKSLGNGLAKLPNKKKEPELFHEENWPGRNLLGRELMQLRSELRILEEDDDSSADEIDDGDSSENEGGGGGGGKSAEDEEEAEEDDLEKTLILEDEEQDEPQQKLKRPSPSSPAADKAAPSTKQCKPTSTVKEQNDGSNNETHSD